MKPQTEISEMASLSGSHKNKLTEPIRSRTHSHRGSKLKWKAVCGAKEHHEFSDYFLLAFQEIKPFLSPFLNHPLILSLLCSFVVFHYP